MEKKYYVSPKAKDIVLRPHLLDNVWSQGGDNQDPDSRGTNSHRWSDDD